METEEESWTLTWFPPDVGHKTRTFKTREAVTRFLDTQANSYEVEYPAGSWNPLLTRRITTIKEEVVEL